jgi:predicted phage baseplate assembly protein
MTLPVENLDDKSFHDLVRDAVARIPVYAPHWTNHNRSDPGITLIELLAWIAEMQMYRQNRINDMSRLKFLKLLGVKGPEPARPSQVDLTFKMENAAACGSLRIPAYTQAAASDPVSGELVIFETLQDLFLSGASLDCLLTIRMDGTLFDNTPANDGGSAFFSAFGGDPSVGDALYLGLDSSPQGQELTAAFYIYQEWAVSEDDEAATDQNPNLIWEYYAGGDWKSDLAWKELKGKSELLDDDWDMVKDGSAGLTVNGKVRIRVGGEASQTTIRGHDLYWIRVRVVQALYDSSPKIESIQLNVIPAMQKATTVTSFSSSGLPGIQISLGQAPVIRESLELVIRGESDKWTRVDDLDASSPGDRHYVLDPATGTISFGDGIHGKIPPAGGSNIMVTFSSGGGIRGNVDAFAVNRVMDSALSQKVSVFNKWAAQGGREPESLEEAIGRAREELESVRRLITAGDYELMAKRTPGLSVARAKAVPLYHPSQTGPVPDTVTVIVVPNSSKPMPLPGTDFLKRVYRHLDLHHTIGTEIFVIPPVYLEVSVKVTVIRMPTYRKETVKKAVEDSLKGFLSPLAGGGPDGEGWPFGRSVYISEIYALLDQVKGVDYIKFLTLVRSSTYKDDGNGAGGNGGSLVQYIADSEETDGAIDMPPYGLACSGEHMVEVFSEDEYDREKFKMSVIEVYFLERIHERIPL